MKELTIEELDIMLCSTGYLPPRTEDELLFFNEMFKDYKIHTADRHIDIESIFNGTCKFVSLSCSDNELSDKSHFTDTEDESNAYSMAARNFDKLPKDILDKMRMQHKSEEEDEK